MSSLNYRRRNHRDKSSNSSYPDLTPHTEKILIIVKAMPTPSKKYRELVCTVGVTEKGQLIRLYPIPYRYMDFSKWYKKYQWIEVNIKKQKKDNRVDSYEPDIKTLKVIGEPLQAGNSKERK